MNCPNCQTNKARMHPLLGVLPCFECNTRQEEYMRAGANVEFTTDSIKQQRKEYKNDIIQPFRKGELSKEYVEVYGAQAAINHGASTKEISKARYVWDDLQYYKEGV